MSRSVSAAQEPGPLVGQGNSAILAVEVAGQLDAKGRSWIHSATVTEPRRVSGRASLIFFLPVA